MTIIQTTMDRSKRMQEYKVVPKLSRAPTRARAILDVSLQESSKMANQVAILRCMNIYHQGWMAWTWASEASPKSITEAISKNWSTQVKRFLCLKVWYKEECEEALVIYSWSTPIRNKTPREAHLVVALILRLDQVKMVAKWPKVTWRSRSLSTRMQSSKIIKQLEDKSKTAEAAAIRNENRSMKPRKYQQRM